MRIRFIIVSSSIDTDRAVVPNLWQKLILLGQMTSREGHAGTEALPAEKTSNRQDDIELMALAMIGMPNTAWSLTFPVVAVDIAENAAEAARRTALEMITEGGRGHLKRAVVVDAGAGVEAEIVILGGHGAIDHHFHDVCS